MPSSRLYNDYTGQDFIALLSSSRDPAYGLLDVR